MAGLFDKIKKDVKKGIEEGIAVVKEGASVVSGKMGELTAEGQPSTVAGGRYHSSF
jgi:hypothetical protein